MSVQPLLRSAWRCWNLAQDAHLLQQTALLRQIPPSQTFARDAAESLLEAEE
jgi:hypothetical protein